MSGYRVDRMGGVHPAVDLEFDRARAASVAAMELARYNAAREAFEGAVKQLGEPMDTRAAVRGVFDAIETLFKLMFPHASRLGASEIKKYLRPLVFDPLTGAERDATGLMLNALEDWINACHQYRHAQGVEESDPPTEQFALLIVSSGAAFLRWLVALDQQQPS